MRPSRPPCPPASPAPAELVGKPGADGGAGLGGRRPRRRRAQLRTATAAAPPALATVEPMAFTTLQSLSDDAAPARARCNYTKGGYLDDDFGDGAIAAMMESAEEMLSDNSLIEVIPHGGAQLGSARTTPRSRPAGGVLVQRLRPLAAGRGRRRPHRLGADRLRTASTATPATASTPTSSTPTRAATRPACWPPSAASATTNWRR